MMNKINDEALETVVGGARRTVETGTSQNAAVRSGAGKGFEQIDLLSRRSVVRSLSVYSSYQMRCDKFWASKKAAVFNVSSRY